MDTTNIVLMIILSAMIGFGIGNVWGKESMKRIFSSLMDQMLKGLKAGETDRKEND